MAVTEFGKELRHIRIEKDWRLYDMAEQLGFSSAYLSAVERSHKAVSDDLLTKVKTLIGADGVLSGRLDAAARESVKQMKISVQERDEFDKILVLSFARQLDALSPEQKRRIFEELNSGEVETQGYKGWPVKR